MSTPPHLENTRERQNRRILADLIDGCKDEIVDRWIRRVEAHVHAGASAAQLRNAIPDYLHRLSLALRNSESSLRRSGSEGWTDVAREHALTRVRLGFDIDQLVREFIVLRQVLCEISEEREIDLDVPHATRVADLIDGAICVAVRSYVEARDYAARQKEAEHISFITHELRNPLSAVRLAADQLRRAMPARCEQLFDVLERNILRVASLIDGVLQMERLQAGRTAPRMINVELGDLLAHPIATAQLAAEAKGLRLRADYDPHTLLWADPELAAASVTNVLDNAVKYTDSGEIRLASELGGNEVSLHVWDNCPGLSEQELGIIFEPFERGHSNKPGSGIGLAVARRAIEAQGGTIGAESSGERGCHFWLALPRAAH